MIKVQIVADSINQQGNRITSALMTYPRIIHAEVITHRMFSRNAASSRAIPTEKLIESVMKDPFIPLGFQSQHSGMQGTSYLNEEDTQKATQLWLQGRDEAVNRAKLLNELGVTKQLANRGLETYQYYTTLITATEWENFFFLRCPQYVLFYENVPMEFRSRKDLVSFAKRAEGDEFKNQYDNLTEIEWLRINKGLAEIHMMALAEAMWDARNESTPKLLQPGEWHIPFGDNIEGDQFKELARKTYPDRDVSAITEQERELLAVKIATARAARTSYTIVGEEGKPDNYENDIKLHDRLSKSGHWSCFEHCAKVMTEYEYEKSYSRQFIEGDKNDYLGELGMSGNFRGFIQYRKMFSNENVK